MPRHSIHLIVLALAFAINGRTADEPKRALPVRELKRKSPVDFEHEILPILKANCLACHNQTSSKADLVLETPQTIHKGGESGPAVTPGKPGESLLFQVASHEKRPLMPPKENKVAASELKPEELGLLKLWIEQGAKGEVRASVPVAWQPVPKNLHPSYAVALTADGQFAACGRANQIAIYHLPSRQLVTRLVDPKAGASAAHSDLVQSLDFSPDGTLLASSAFREVKLWRRKSRSHILPLAPPPSLAELSPDGSLIASARSTNEISIQDLQAKSPRHKLELTNGPARALRFSPNNGALAALLENRSVNVWNLEGGGLLTTVAVEAHAFCWAGSNRFALVVSNSVQVWSLSSNTTNSPILERTLSGQSDAIFAIAGSSNSLLIGNVKGDLRLWDLTSGKEVAKCKQESPITALAISEDGLRFASGGSNKVVKLWSSEGKRIADLQGDRYADEALASAERNLSLAKAESQFQTSAFQTAQKEQTNQLTRLSKAKATNELVNVAFFDKQKALNAATDTKAKAEQLLSTLQHELQLATNEVAIAGTNAVADVHASAPVAATSTNKTDASVKALRDRITEAAGKITAASNAVATVEKEFRKTELTRSIAAHELTLASNSLATAVRAVADLEATLKIARRDEQKRLSELDSAKEHALASQYISRLIAFSPDNRTLAVADEQPGVHTWNTDSGKALEVYRSTNGPIVSLGFNSAREVEALGGTSLLSWKLDPVWKLERTIGSAAGDSPFADRVNCARFSRDGKLLATGGGEPSRLGEIKLWNVESGQLARDLPNIHSDSVFSLDFSPNGKLLASGAADKFLRVTSLESGKLIKTFEGHTHHVLGVGWKQDGRTLASAGADAMVKTWNAATGERIKNIEGFNKEVTSASFVGTTGQILATAGDGQFRLVKETGDNVRAFSGATDFLYSAAATPDGKTVIAAGLDGVLRVWNGEDGKLSAEFGP